MHINPYDSRVLITKPVDDAPERTWRLPLDVRIARVIGTGVIVALPAGYVALTLWTNQVPHAIWIALAAGLAAWGFLAGRVLAQSVTLTADTVVIRNIFTTERVPLADVTEVSFHRSKLTVTSQHGPFAPDRNTVGTAVLGLSYWSGRRASADRMADAINDAAGLPPLPPRREIISPNRARLLLVAAAVIFGLGVYLGPVEGMRHLHRSLALGEVGAVLYSGGISALVFAYRLTRDHRRKHRARLRR
jgi:hypothetical protein